MFRAVDEFFRSPLVTVMRWRCRDKAAHCTNRAADRGAQGCTVPAGCGSPDRSPAAGTDQAASDRSLDGVIWIGASR
jgi:hypothetical protein